VKQVLMKPKNGLNLYHVKIYQTFLGCVHSFSSVVNLHINEILYTNKYHT